MLIDGSVVDSSGRSHVPVVKLSFAQAPPNLFDALPRRG